VTADDPASSEPRARDAGSDRAAAPDPQARWRRVRALYDAASELPAADRAACVHASAAEDPTLAAEVLELLAIGADDEVSPTLRGVLASALEVGGADDALARRDDERINARIGPYRLQRLIGRGGMGAVYAAVRDDGEFAQDVAIKLLRAGAESGAALRRFRRERQLLAALRHPNIAALLDGGVTSDGVPYLVMELVEGDPITRHADARGLDARARVRLARQVCAAVRHAHAQLVVHRDLKPANILVSTDGRVRLLDFGISRLLSGDGRDDAAPPTETIVHSLTPEYASPEQFEGLPVGIASDVYSLGVVLYELLAGVRPYSLSGLGWSAMLARVRDADIAPPSRVARDGVARVRAVRGDLDAIVLQALAKDPAQRYPTVDALDADLAAWLEGRPVRVRGPSLTYRAAKLLRRRPLEVAAGAVAFAALVATVVISRAAAARAERAQAQTAQVNAFLQQMLASASPDVGGRDLTVREVLGQAATRLATGTLPPELTAELHFTLASSYYGLGDWGEAGRHADSASRIRTRLLGRDALATLEADVLRAAAAEGLGDNARAIALIDTAVRRLRAAPAVDDRRLAEALDHQSRILELTGDRARVDAIIDEALALRERSRDSATRAGLPNALNSRAVSLIYQGRTAEAEDALRRAIASEAALSGDGTPDHAEYRRALAELLAQQGRHAEADTLMRGALATLERALGGAHTTYLRARAAGVVLRIRAGDPRGALALAEPVVAAIGGALPEGDLTAANVLQYVGAAHDSLGEFDAGERALVRALALRRASLPDGHWAIASAEAIVGAHHLLTGAYAQAEPLLRRGWEGVAAVHGASSPMATAIAARLARLYDATGRPAVAAAWRERATTASP
jgi:serine/threonine-protein kinase